MSLWYRPVHHREQLPKLWRIVGDTTSSTLIPFRCQPPIETGTAQRGNGWEEQQCTLVGEQRHGESEWEGAGKYTSTRLLDVIIKIFRFYLIDYWKKKLGDEFRAFLQIFLWTIYFIIIFRLNENPINPIDLNKRTFTLFNRAKWEKSCSSSNPNKYSLEYKFQNFPRNQHDRS